MNKGTSLVVDGAIGGFLLGVGFLVLALDSVLQFQYNTLIMYVLILLIGVAILAYAFNKASKPSAS